MKNTIIIQGSSNSYGNTHKVVSYFNKNSSFDVVDLNIKNIGYFSYDYANANDDFLPLMQHIIPKYDTIIFATPVYWYSMSAIMKTFFDRLSDLLHYKKDLGRQLRGKNLAFISNSGDNDRKQGFEMPFVESANYLGMHYLGNVHIWFSEDNIADEAKTLLDEFRMNITSK